MYAYLCKFALTINYHCITIIIMNTYTIPLTRGLFAIVDAEDYEYLSGFNWQARPSGTGLMYASAKINGRTKAMHRAIMGDPIGMQIHHINHDGLDNRRQNLRIVTQTTNLRMKRMYRNNTTGYRGVVMLSDGKYQARVAVKYDNAEDAARAFDAMALAVYGPDAMTNFNYD